MVQEARPLQMLIKNPLRCRVCREHHVSGIIGKSCCCALQTFKFERMGCFAFSEEDGTPAATYPGQVPAKLRQRRRDELISLQQRIGEEFAASLVGKEVGA
jgi:hypothetical protein